MDRGGEARANPFAIPIANPRKDQDAKKGYKREPEKLMLAMGHDDEGGHEGTDRRTGIATDLKERLGESVGSTGCRTGNPGCLGMEDRGAKADHPGGGDDGKIVRGKG